MVWGVFYIIQYRYTLMGGKALKIARTRRYTNSELHEAEKKIREVFKRYDPNILKSIHVSKYPEDKEDHGDLDLYLFVSNKDAFYSTLEEFIQYNFKPVELVPNGPTWSFDFNDLQVDLNIGDHGDEEVSMVWYSYSDLSILLQRLFRFWRLKWTPRGLLYEAFAHGKSVKLAELLIDKSPEKIFECMGYSWERYQQGFKNMIEIFEFVSSSPKFSMECCDRKYMTNDVRIRDNKRQNVIDFDTWLSDHPVKYFARPEKDEMYKMIDKYFGGVLIDGERVSMIETIQKLKDQQRMKDMAAMKFNGADVIKHFGLSGPVLGNALERFKKSVPGDYFEYLLDTEYTQILKDFERSLTDI